MGSITTVLLAGVIAVVGRMVKDEPVTSRAIVAFILLALMISLIGQANEQLGNGFGALILIYSLTTYALPIAGKLGFK